MSVAYSDIYSALSWDHLHAYNLGLFGIHLWKEFKEQVVVLGKATEKQVDDQYV